MTANLLLSVFALLVALVTFATQALTPRERTPGSPPPPTVLRGVFGTVAFGVVPLLASLAFFGAWWMESGTANAQQAAAVHRPLSDG